MSLVPVVFTDILNFVTANEGMFSGASHQSPEFVLADNKIRQK